MTFRRVFLIVTLMLATSCDGCDGDGLTRVCPGIDHAGPLTLTSSNTEDVDNDGFGTCAGDCDDQDRRIYPGATETCNNIDDDCDGSVDELLEVTCWTGPIEASFKPESRCREGTKTCTAGWWSDCHWQSLPIAESCNEIDDDCDGDVDEPVVQGCGPLDTTGACEKGTLVCEGGESWCVGAIFSQSESCDGLDNDCDNWTDEELERRCETICGRGFETCKNGSWVDCSAPQPGPEVCNGLDDDCNGVLDDGIECRCVWSPDPTERDVTFCTGGGLTCGIGISECLEDGSWGPCMPYAISDEQCNNWDDDCDGISDGMVETCGDQVHAGHGVCLLGERSCELGEWTDCIGSVDPTVEVCDDVDNDCDDSTDEDLTPYDKVDVWFIIDGSGSMCPRVMALQAGLAAYANDFRNTEHRFGFGIFPGVNDTIDVITPPVDIDAFLAALTYYSCNFAGVEPGWEAMAWSANPASAASIGWRVPMPISGTPDIDPGAFPYLILIGDEDPDQTMVLTEADVTNEVTDCQVGSCPLDCQNGVCTPRMSRFETFVLTGSSYWLMWDGPTYFEQNRLVEIDPADATRYTEIFRGFLRNVCR